MTYCLGIKLKSGLVSLADRRITSGTETTTGRKVFVHQKENHSMFIMTSGLRSVRDKAITYFREVIEEQDEKFNKMYKAVNAFAQELRRVAMEDKKPLVEAGYDFNLQAIVGGQLEEDKEPKLYRLYSEGNWVEVGPSTPYVIIGNSGYGKPVLDRVLKYDSSLKFALKTGFLSFDATRKSSNDVDFPLDVLIYRPHSFHVEEYTFAVEDLKPTSEAWEKLLIDTIDRSPEDWMNRIFNS